MALAATCRTYYAKRPGYVKAERQAMFAKVTDWACCRGIRNHLWARPAHAR